MEAGGQQGGWTEHLVQGDEKKKNKNELRRYSTVKPKIRAPYPSRLAYAACLTLILGLAWNPAAHADLSGRAFAAFINTPSLSAGPLYISDTGELGPDGGWNAADLLNTQIPSVLSATTLVAATVGSVTKASSSTSLADLVVLPGHAAQLTASFVRSEATTTDTGSSGTTEIYELTVGEVTVPVTGLPNQKVEIPGLLGPVATLLINEQVATARGITVNGLHLILATGEEVIVSSARSGVNAASGTTGILPNPLGSAILAASSSDTTCVPMIGRVRTLGLAVFPEEQLSTILVSGQPPPPERCFDFVTGGGFLFGSTEGPGRVNFGFNAGYKNGSKVPLMAHLNLIDHNTGRHVKVQSATSYGPGSFFGDPCRCRQFEGSATSNGTPVTYIATVCDFGEPGNAPKGTDKFGILLSDGYSVGVETDPVIEGGNIQLHKACPQEGCNGNSAGASTETGKTPSKVEI